MRTMWSPKKCFTLSLWPNFHLVRLSKILIWALNQSLRLVLHIWHVCQEFWFHVVCLQVDQQPFSTAFVQCSSPGGKKEQNVSLCGKDYLWIFLKTLIMHIFTGAVHFGSIHVFFLKPLLLHNYRVPLEKINNAGPRDLLLSFPCMQRLYGARLLLQPTKSLHFWK